MISKQEGQKMNQQLHQQVQQLRITVICFVVFSLLQLIVFSVIHWESRSKIIILEHQVRSIRLNGDDIIAIKKSDRMKKSWMQHLANSESTASCTCEKGEKGDPGIPGPPGMIGAPGALGLDGTKGQKGDSSSVLLQNTVDGQPSNSMSRCTCPPGAPGVPGMPGRDGAKGEIGMPGRPGVPGSGGVRGPGGRTDDLESDCGCPPGAPGRQGDVGRPGLPGFDGLPGMKGEPGTCGC